MPRRTKDERAAKAKRDYALERHELRQGPRPKALDADQLAKAMREGKFTKLPPGRPTRER